MLDVQLAAALLQVRLTCACMLLAVLPFTLLRRRCTLFRLSACPAMAPSSLRMASARSIQFVSCS